MVECLFKINQVALTFIAKKLNEDIFREKTKTRGGAHLAVKNVVYRKNESLIFFYI